MIRSMFDDCIRGQDVRQKRTQKGRTEIKHCTYPSELAGGQDARGVVELVGDDDLLDLVTEDILDRLGQVLEALDVLLAGRLLLIGLLQLESVLGDADELLALELLELGRGVFVEGINHEEDLESLLLEDFEERRGLDGGHRLSGEVVDVLLNFGHASDVV
jgi:hypothetical protein